VSTSTEKVPFTALTIGKAELAEMLGISPPALDRLRVAEKVIPPLHLLLPGKVRWIRSEAEAWIAAGCPDPKVWSARRNGRAS
jgi:predicted DNA-binding transcriptional regulator AlpA